MILLAQQTYFLRKIKNGHECPNALCGMRHFTRHELLFIGNRTYIIKLTNVAPNDSGCYVVELFESGNCECVVLGVSLNILGEIVRTHTFSSSISGAPISSSANSTDSPIVAMSTVFTTSMSSEIHSKSVKSTYNPGDNTTKYMTVTSPNGMGGSVKSWRVMLIPLVAIGASLCACFVVCGYIYFQKCSQHAPTVNFPTPEANNKGKKEVATLSDTCNRLSIPANKLPRNMPMTRRDYISSNREVGKYQSSKTEVSLSSFLRGLCQCIFVKNRTGQMNSVGDSDHIDCSVDKDLCEHAESPQIFEDYLPCQIDDDRDDNYDCVATTVESMTICYENETPTIEDLALHTSTSSISCECPVSESIKHESTLPLSSPQAHGKCESLHRGKSSSMPSIYDRLQRRDPEIFLSVTSNQAKRCSTPNRYGRLLSVCPVNSRKVCNHKPVRITEGTNPTSINKEPPTRFVQGPEPITYERSQQHDSGLGGRDEKTKGISENESEKRKQRHSDPIYFSLNCENCQYDLVSMVQTSTERQKSSERISKNKNDAEQKILYSLLHRTMNFRAHQNLLIKFRINFQKACRIRDILTPFITHYKRKLLIITEYLTFTNVWKSHPIFKKKVWKKMQFCNIMKSTTIEKNCALMVLVKTYHLHLLLATSLQIWASRLPQMLYWKISITLCLSSL